MSWDIPRLVAAAATELSQPHSVESIGVAINATTVVWQKPLAPPNGWTHFMGWLSGISGMDQITRFRLARDTVSAYDQQQQQSIGALEGIVRELKTAYGQEIVDLCLPSSTVGVKNMPLRARALVELVRSVKTVEAGNILANARRVAHFLDPSAPAASSGQETDEGEDMNDVFYRESLRRDSDGEVPVASGDVWTRVALTEDAVDEVLPAAPRPGWKEAVGEGAADFISAYVRQQCSAAPVYARSHVGNAPIVAAATEALALYRELAKLPWMTNEMRDELLAVHDGMPPISLRDMRENILLDELKREFLDYANSEAPFCRRATQLAQKYGQEAFAPKVLRDISGSIEMSLRCGFLQLSKELGCADDLPSLYAALKQKLPVVLENALEQHAKALAQIEASPIFNEAQKAHLLHVAAGRRFDPAQLAACEDYSVRMSRAIPSLCDALEGEDTAAFYAGLHEGLSTYQAHIVPIRQVARALWCGEGQRGREQFVADLQQLGAVAVLRLSADAAGESFERLTMQDGCDRLADLCGIADVGTRVSWMTMNYCVLEALAERSGRPKQEIDAAFARLDRAHVVTEHMSPELKRELHRVRGAATPEFCDAMRTTLEAPLVEAEQATTRLPISGRKISRQLLRELNGQVMIIAVPGAAPIGGPGWVQRPEAERSDLLEAAYTALRSLCNDDEKKALAITLAMHQGLAAPFEDALRTVLASSPLRLPDGTPVRILNNAHNEMRVSLRKNPAGEVVIHLDFSASGLSIVESMVDMSPHSLDWINSYVKYSFDSTLLEGGGLKLEGPVIYDICLMNSEWKRKYPEPSLDDLREMGPALFNDLLALAKGRPIERYVLALAAVNAFRLLPSMDAAKRIYDGFIGLESPHRLDDALADIARDEIENIPSNKMKYSRFLEGILKKIGEELLPEFIVKGKKTIVVSAEPPG